MQMKCEQGLHTCLLCSILSMMLKGSPVQCLPGDCHACILKGISPFQGSFFNCRPSAGKYYMKLLVTPHCIFKFMLLFSYSKFLVASTNDSNHVFFFII